MTKFNVALTFDDVNTIWVYKASITRMVGRLFVSVNEVLVQSVATLQVASCRDDKGYQMLFSVQLEGEYSPAFKTHFYQRIGNFDIVPWIYYNFKWISSKSFHDDFSLKTNVYFNRVLYLYKNECS
jgi:hypothetical protein